MEHVNLRREYEVSLGRLFTNMLSLEMLLRLYLFSKESAPESRNFDFGSLKEGDNVPENYFTDTCGLRHLIEKYNTYCKKNFSELKVDPDLADIRNALAHGRVLSSDPNFSKTQLFNFVSDKEGQIRLAFIALMTKDWFTKQIKLFFNAMDKVHKNLRKDFPAVVGEIEWHSS